MLMSGYKTGLSTPIGWCFIYRYTSLACSYVTSTPLCWTWLFVLGLVLPLII